MSSQHLESLNSQHMEEKMSEALDKTMNTTRNDHDSDLNNASDPVNTSNDSDEPGSSHIQKKAKVTHTPTSCLEATSNITCSADSNRSNSSTCSNDSKAANDSQSSKTPMCPEELSAEHQTTTASKEYFAIMVRDTSDSRTSDDESPSPRISEAFYSKYRKSSPDLMTLHMFTGKMRGKRPIYIPVYERSDDGKLWKLVKSWSGDWEYVEMKKLSEEEKEEGLKIFEKPKAKVMSKRSEPGKAVGRRTIADFGLPETESKGGWGWL